MATKKAVDTRDKITSHLKKIERSYAWLATKTKIPYGTIYSIFKQKHINLSEENLNKINGILGTKY